MASRKKKESQVHLEQDDEACCLEAFGGLVMAVVEESGERIELEDDPFNKYVYTMCDRMHKDTGLFETRFTRGYRVLLEQLKQEK